MRENFTKNLKIKEKKIFFAKSLTFINIYDKMFIIIIVYIKGKVLFRAALPQASAFYAFVR